MSIRVTDSTGAEKQGTPITGASMPAGGKGLVGWLSAIWKIVYDRLPTFGTAGTASANVLTVQGIASMTALKVDGSAATQPVSAASLPLPTGAATAAKQPALGTAGSASADVISVQGVASMTPIAIADGGSSLTVDDGGGTITVDGAVSVTGEVDVLPASPSATDYLPVRLTSGSAFLSALPVTDNSGSLSVDDNGGSITIDDGGSSLTVDNAGTFATQATLQGGTNYAGKVRLTDGTTDTDVRDLTNSNALNVSVVDGNGDQVTSFGGGTQYTEGDTDATITGTAAMWEDGSNTLRAISMAKPLPVQPGTSTAWPVTDNGGTLSIDDGGGTITVDGSVNANVTGSVTADVSGSAVTATVSGSVTASCSIDAHPLTEGTLIASGTYNATRSSGDEINPGYRGVTVFLNVTANGSGTLSLIIQGKCPASGAYVNLHLANAWGAATGASGYVVGGAGNTSASIGYVRTGADQGLPATWRVTVTHSGGTNWTYSVGFSYNH